MNDTLTFVLAGMAGLALGVVFFGGLWWTIRKGVASPRPALWFFSSMVLRMAIVLVGLYWVGRGEWRRLMACLVGFIVARIAVTLLTRPKKENAIEKEAGHAS